MTGYVHIYTISWDGGKGKQQTMTTNSQKAERQARAGAHVTAETKRIADPIEA